jgi:hypothetical protein
MERLAKKKVFRKACYLFFLAKTEEQLYFCHGCGTTTDYYDKYGGSIGSSTTRENYGGGTTTTYYDAYGNTIGSSSDW